MKIMYFFIGLIIIVLSYFILSWFLMDGRIYTSSVRNFDAKEEATEAGFLLQKKCFIQTDNIILYKELIMDSIWITKFEYSKNIGLFGITYKREIDTNRYVIHINHNHNCENQFYKNNINEKYYSEWCNPFWFSIDNKESKKLFCAIRDKSSNEIKYLGYLKFEFTDKREDGERTLVIN